MVLSQNTKHTYTYDPAISLLGIYTEKRKLMSIQKHNNIICDRQKLGTTKMPFNKVVRKKEVENGYIHTIRYYLAVKKNGRQM